MRFQFLLTKEMILTCLIKKRASSLIYMDKKTNPVAKQTYNESMAMVSPTMTSGEDSHTSRTIFSNNSNKKSSSGISLIREKYNKSKHIEGDEEEYI